MAQNARPAIWLAITLLFAVCWPDTSFAQKRFALVIGNKDYAPGVGGALKNPLNDVDLISKALTNIGFQVVLLQNATRIEISRGVKNLATKLGDAGDNAIGFLYYSGHGVARAQDRSNYLIPIDVRDMSNDDFWFNAVSLDVILKELQVSAPRAAQFVVFDACRNELRLPTKGAVKGFEPVFQTSGLFIAFSTSPNDTASDVGDASGPYARALADELGRPGQDQLTLFQNVKERVFASTGKQPWESNGFIRRVYLSMPKEPPRKDPEPMETPGRVSPSPGQTARVSPSPEEQPQLTFSPWTKFCLKGQEANAKQVCFTGKDGRVELGMPVVAAVLIEPENDPKKVLRVTLPLGMSIQPGTRVIVDNDKPISGPYVICFNNGCMADYVASGELIGKLKRGQGLVVQGVNGSGQPISLVVPLNDFAKAFDGPPTDPKKFEEQQKQLAEELKRKEAARPR